MLATNEAPSDAKAYVERPIEAEAKLISPPRISAGSWKTHIRALRKGSTINSPGKGGKSSPAGPYLGWYI